MDFVTIHFKINYFIETYSLNQVIKNFVMKISLIKKFIKVEVKFFTIMDARFCLFVKNQLVQYRLPAVLINFIRFIKRKVRLQLLILILNSLCSFKLFIHYNNIYVNLAYLVILIFIKQANQVLDIYFHKPIDHTMFFIMLITNNFLKFMEFIFEYFNY